MLEELAFAMSLEYPHTKYKIRKGDKFVLRIVNYDQLLVTRLHVKVPPFYWCQATLHFKEVSKTLLLGTQKESKLHTIDLEKQDFSNYVKLLKFEFLTDRSPALNEQYEFVELDVFIDFALNAVEKY